MKDELLKVIRRTLLDALAAPDDLALIEAIRNLSLRFRTLAARLRGSSDYRDAIDRWYNEIFFATNKRDQWLSIDKIIREIDDLKKKISICIPDDSEPSTSWSHSGTVSEYLCNSLSVTHETLSSALDKAVKASTALTSEPPWRHRKDVLDQKKILVLVDARTCPWSTEELLDQFKRIFQKIVSAGKPRPKLWILPTVERGRVVVAIGESDVVELLLKPVVSFQNCGD